MISEKEVGIKASDGSNIIAFQASPEHYTAGIIVIHEIFGLTDYIKNVARRLANEGYLAVAPNLYSRKINVLTPENIAGVMRRFWSLPPEKRNDAQAISQLLSTLSEKEKEVYSTLMQNRDSLENQMLDDLKSVHKYVMDSGAKKIGVIGFCMGGGLSFQISTMVPFDATVVYYGRNPRNIGDISKLKGPVLAMYAGEDSGINAGLPELMSAIIKYKPSFEMKLYPGTYHAFATEGGPVYNEAAAKDAWERTVNFYKKNLG
ncbi:carboxymethylenebutenolidase [Sulfolobales archaeon HS-7]|nr:carboxymethylenebutenolidase [Sulfolobales archaeon HS-7]